jgi:hypothetical protein
VHALQHLRLFLSVHIFVSFLGRGYRKSGGQPAHPLTLFQSDRAVIPGSRLYAYDRGRPAAECGCLCSGVKTTNPFKMILDPISELKPEEPQYLKLKVLFLPAIQESVPVSDGKFQISEDAVVSAVDDLVASLGAGRIVSVHGTLR